MRKLNAHCWGFKGFLTAVVFLFTQASVFAAPLKLDQLFVGGIIYDGSGDRPYRADLGIQEGKILFIGDANGADIQSKETIDISGHWIAPGFIDMHSHAELDLEYGQDAKPYLMQGVTTVLLGLDGFGDSDVAARFALWERQGIGVNAGLYVGHNSVRLKVMGAEDRAPTPNELETMKQLVDSAMKQGALGLSTGLFYVPGKYSKTEEVIELAKVAAAYDGAIYDTHDRDLGAAYKGVGYDASVKEAIRIAEESGLRGIFSHFTPQGRHNYGRGHVGAKLINDARARGVSMWAAQHPYTATQSSLRAYTMPGWATAGGREVMVTRFDDAAMAAEIANQTEEMLAIRGGAEKILIVDPRPELNGKTLAQVAMMLGKTPEKTAQHLLRGGSVGVMNLELYDIENIKTLGQEDWMMTGTDGRTPRPDQKITHPRTFGAFARKMRLMALDDSLASPEFIIRSFTGLAADFLSLPDRGYLREGYVADIVILDPDSYRDKATFEAPREYTEGVAHVLVNGHYAIKGGRITGVLAGKPLHRPK